MNLKMWITICGVICLTASIVPIVSSNENNHEDQPVIHADEVHMINDTVKLDCTMHGDITNLTFYQIKSGKQIDLVFEKVNNTTIRHVTNAEAGTKEYFCEDRVTTKKAIKIIQGGTPPSKVDNFNCISYNFEILNCTWIGSNTGLLMEYEAYQNTSKDRQIKTIKATVINETERLYSCIWLFKDDANHLYENAEHNFSIVLAGSNALGKYEEFFPIHHFSIVKPNPPTNLKSFNEGTHETTLSWKLDDYLNEFLEDHLLTNIEVDLKSNDFERVENKTFVLQNQKTKDVIYTLKELPYAHLTYRVRISMKLMQASDKFWSDAAEIFFNTTSEIPKPPDVPTGAYYETTEITENKRQITLYWKEHSKFEHGGNNFSYYINVLGNHYTKSYYTPLGFLQIDVPLEDVRVSIFSENEEGRSRESIQYIPSISKKLNITAFTMHDYNNGSHLLYWSSYPQTFQRNEDSNNFTIMWCKNEINNECRDINYTTISGKERNFLTDLPEGNYQFAIAANSNNGTSGLKWVDCKTDSSLPELYSQMSSADVSEEVVKKANEMVKCELIQTFIQLQCDLERAVEKLD